MIAIVTKTLPATNTRGCRLVATAPARDPRKRVVVAYDHGASNWENHVAVAEAYRKRFLTLETAGEDFVQPPDRVGTAQSGLNSYTSLYITRNEA